MAIKNDFTSHFGGNVTLLFHSHFVFETMCSIRNNHTERTEKHPNPNPTYTDLKKKKP